MDTISEIRAQLNTHKGDWPGICRDTGLNYHWITKFAQGRIADPSSTKISKLTARLADLAPSEKSEAA